MSREPAYPKDAAVGPTPDAETAATAASGDANAPGKRDESRRRKQLVTGAAIGIGSAAIVAALLYANRGRRSDPS
jgi:hypothetical protein